MVEVKFCEKCLSRYVGDICTSCGGKYKSPKSVTKPKKVEGKGKQAKELY